VAVNPVPTVSFNDTTICEGTSATLVGTPNILGGAYLWSNGANTQQINVSPSVTTNYTLIYNLNGCGDTISEFVYVNPLPSAQINQNPTICYGSATTLTSSVSPANGTYEWIGFGLSGVNNQNQVTVSPQNGNSTQNASHIYELVYTLNGCTDTAFTTVDVNLIPSVLGLASEDTICPGQNIQLSATGTPTISNGNSGAYSWSTANPISSIGNSAIVSVSPITNTTYEVVYTMNGCNSPAYPVSITIQTAPQITIQNNPNATICEGGCVTLTAVPAASTITPSGYSWSTGETTQSIQVCPTDTTQYTVIGLSGTCQSPVATTTVNVTGDPVISSNLMADTSMCVGGSFTFNLATSGGVGTPSYTWYLNNQPNNYSGAALPNSNNASYSTPTIVQPTTQYYYAQVTYPGVGCNQLTSDLAQLNVVADPIVALDPVFNQTLCEGGTATCIAPVVTGGVGSNTYLWLPTMSADEIFCPPSDQIGTQNYNVIVQQSGIGCGSIPSNTIAITVVADPTIQIVGTANVCEGAEVPLITTVQGGLGTISSYQWSSSYPNGNPYININGANAFNYTTFILEDQVGIAVNMAQSVEGCNASDTFLINVFEDPQVSIIGDSLTCMGLVNNLQTLVTGGVPNSTNTFTWFSPGTEQNPTPYVVQSTSQQSTYDGTISSDTSYIVSVDNSGFGCDNDTSAVFEVSVVQWAVANFDIDPEIPSQSILNPTFSFINTSENSTSYLWDLGECDPQLPYSELYTSPTLTYNPNSVDQINYTYGCSPGYYSVTLYAFNQGMCPDTVTQIIRIRDEVIVYVPNAFTPGDLDNTNATFYPVITGKIKPGTYRFSVFDRWGELIFETYDPTATWDGRYYKNQIVQSGALSSDDFVQDGVYIWKLSFIAEETGDKIDRVGHVTKLQSDLGN
ncbi:MAG: gliding motility-associated C-terminal domain-containing protein, partial [Crocinitomicaceae bacterium]|nr:gliding motility-associated C-terminal domain-containing protein [Crocinitomicaceae bacterium]